MGIRKDWSGQKFGMLTLLSQSEKQKSDGSFFWHAKCDCGNDCLVLPNSARRGETVSCGHANLNMLRHQGGLNRRHEPRISSARAVWATHYKECEFDFFLSMSQEACYYCGRLPYRVYNCAQKVGKRKYGASAIQKEQGDFTYNGLDRVDSTKTHTPDNVVPCCIECNQAKMDMTLDEFLDHIERMYEHTRRLRSAVY
jgi:hypothetical protein